MFILFLNNKKVSLDMLMTSKTRNFIGPMSNFTKLFLKINEDYNCKQWWFEDNVKKRYDLMWLVIY